MLSIWSRPEFWYLVELRTCATDCLVINPLLLTQALFVFVYDYKNVNRTYNVSFILKFYIVDFIPNYNQKYCKKGAKCMDTKQVITFMHVHKTCFVQQPI